MLGSDSHALSPEARKFQARVAQIQGRARITRTDPSRWPYRDAAAVLSRFKPEELHPLLDTDSGPKGWTDFLPDCEPALAAGSSEGWWQLRDNIRRDALRHLGSRQRMQKALNANSPLPDDPMQRALTELIATALPNPLTSLSREELSAIMIVRDWLNGVLDGLPSETELRRTLIIAEVLEPLKRLAGNGRFLGRRNELETLREYIGVRAAQGAVASRIWSYVRKSYYDFRNNPPYLITGPGGVGKSTLLARVILDHSENFAAQDALPFAYLDLDRAALDPARPLTLVADAALQLMIEWPHLERPLHSIVDRLTSLSGGDATFYEDVRGASSSDQLIFEFGKLLAEGSGQRPVLFAIDTFEEAQYLGFDVVDGMARLLTSLQAAAPMLRIVLAGRGDLDDQTSVLSARALHLGDMSQDEARELLRLNIMIQPTADAALIDEVIDLVGRNPLSLKLAATVVNQQGVQALQTVETRNWLLLRVKAETVQARLYGRILAHIHDDDIRKMVKPGLIVRRLTADVIREVLAIPCDLSLSAPNAADNLMERLGKELALFYRDPDGSLRHRPDVRRLMLKDLANDIPAATVREVHDGAIAYYQKQPAEPVARAEEIYHRLMRGDIPASAESRWIAGMEIHLRTALEEVPAAAQIWLSAKLGVTPDRTLLTRAEIEDRERITAVSVQRLLSSGDVAGALKALGTRSDRTDSSPLFLLESEAYRRSGSWQKARETAERGIAGSARAGEIVLQRNLLVQLSLIEETAGSIQQALARIDQALDVAANSIEPVEKLRAVIARIRLLRKLGTTRDIERRDAIDKALELLTPAVLDSLNQQPGLLREVVAELGQVRPELLNQALEIVKLPSPTQGGAGNLANALSEWDNRLSKTSGGRSSELAQRAGLKAGDSGAWLKYLSDIGPGVFSQIMNWRAEMQPDRGVDKAVVDLYRSGVDAALGLVVKF